MVVTGKLNNGGRGGWMAGGRKVYEKMSEEGKQVK